MGALLPCGSREKLAPPRPAVDLSAQWRRAAEVVPLPGPNEELEELLGERSPETNGALIGRPWDGSW